MSHVVEHVNQTLLMPAGLSIDALTQVMGQIHQRQVDYSDFYFQHSRHESWMLEDGIIKDGSFNIDAGVGVRAVSGEKTGFAYSDDISLQVLQQAADTAKGIVRQGQDGQIAIPKVVDFKPLYQGEDPLNTLTSAEKVALLHKAEQLTRQQDPRVQQVIVTLSGVFENILILASDGTLAADQRPLIRLNISVIVEQNGRRERGSSGGGGRHPYQLFTDDLVEQYAKQAVQQAVINLDAIEAPAGTMPVVLGPGWPGVLLHEAVGHGLEADFNRKGASTFSGRIGEKVASKHVTVVDDGTLQQRRGSLSIDDEGTPTGCTTLIEKGRLVGYMQDKLNARLMGAALTGNGRRESYAHLPMPRMTNTYMQAGSHKPMEVIAAVQKGLYASNFGGGQVDITSGKFVFSASEAYLIEDGRITQPVKGATLIGNGPEVMQRISMVADDLELDSGIGVCGKDGQSVPVGVGQPTLLVEKLTVGGTQ